MAEKEKRRATTFRTSKGTIVNVQYPDIYVSPAFISTLDVTNPAELREALREELDDLGIRNVLSPVSGTDYSMGVGTPFLCQLAIGGPIYFLFAGWKTTDGSAREVFIGEIDEDFVVSSIRKLIAVNDPNASFTGHDAVHAVYDSWNNQWMVFTSSFYTPLNTYVACLFRYNSDFSTSISTVAPLLLGGVTWQTQDSGVCPGRTDLKSMQLVYSDHTEAKLMAAYTADFSVASPTFVSQTIPVWPKTTAGFPGLGSMPDVSQLVRGVTGKVVLTESPFSNHWEIYPVFIAGPHPDFYTDTTPELGIGGFASESVLPVLGSYDALGYGHPHLTWLPDKKNQNLFFSLFHSCHPKFFHSIYVIRLPQSRLNYRSYKNLTFWPWKSASISIDASCYPFLGCGRKTIYFTSNTVGNLTILMDVLGDGTWETLEVIPGITSRIYQTTYEARFMKLKFSVAAIVSAKIVLEASL